MEQQQVYKTTVTCTLGYSICDPSGDWEKSAVEISSEIGPGYPTKEMMTTVLNKQMEDALSACNKQIEEVAQSIIETAQKKVI